MPQKPREQRPWLKFWSKEWLEGSIRFDCNAEERGIFADLLALANESRNRGIIQANEVKPYPHRWIAGMLNITDEEFEKALKKFIEQERVEETQFGLKIVNFAWYNREFSKPGRPTKTQMQRPTPKESDPNKYSQGKYADAMCETPEDLERIKEIRQQFKT